MKGSERKMKHSQEEILKALHVIKDTCEEHRNCENTCPFERNGDCIIQDRYPEEWNINDNSAMVWKGLL